ncbi:MAG: M48 family metallopeptidase [Thiomicrorhabdus sp.]|nr:M48 family metallopeptidase [Thiomicrorhabdus sp.]
MFKSSTSPLTHHTVGNQTLEIVRTARKSSIALKVKANKIVVLVPKHYSNKRLKNVLSLNQTWLIHTLPKLEHTLQTQPQVQKFHGKNGEFFHFLGRNVTIVLQSNHSNEGGGKNDSMPQVHIKGAHCFVVGGTQSKQHVCFVLEQFLIQTAQAYLPSKLKYYAQRIGVTYQSVTVKGYKSRWGSCCLDGRLQFNWRLWQAPEWVIDYVIVHELCHRIHPNHSQKFWALVMQHYPRTNEAKQMIKQQGNHWIQFLRR